MNKEAPVKGWDPRRSYAVLSLLLVLVLVSSSVHGFVISTHVPKQTSYFQYATGRCLQSVSPYPGRTRDVPCPIFYSNDHKLFASPAGDDFFMASLKSRMDEVSDRATKLPLVVLDSMLPRQILKIQVKNAVLTELVKTCIQNETPFFGMLGMARLVTGEAVHLKRGVEVEIIDPEFVEGGGVRLTLLGGRRFEILGEIETSRKGWTEARVSFLDFQEEEEKEVLGDDRMAVARAISKATELTSPNMQTENNLSLVDRWIVLAKQVEREPGQIDRLLEDLGERPPQEQPSELAFWVGALINPLPAMGVAMEVRPALLSAKTAEDRVQLALDGIWKSIKHMEGTKQLW